MLDFIKTFGVNFDKKLGLIISLKDGIAQVINLGGAFFGEIVWVHSAQTDADLKGLVVGLLDNVVEVVLLEGINQVSEGDTVIRSNTPVGMLVSDAVLGRVIDSLGRPLDGHRLFYPEEDLTKDIKYQAFFNNSPEILDRDPVNEPLQTGYKGIDSLIPVGLGQRELVIGDRKTGKTSLLIDTVINQKDKNVYCIYVMIGQKRAELARIVQELKTANALNHTILISADSASPAGMQYVAAFAGCSVADYFRKKGKDIILILDDLSKHADSYRQMSLLLRRPPGREAFPGDIFYLHSRILERAANTKKRNAVGPKQGSITALPIIETQSGDVSAYIPTNIISITDGQIFLDKMLFNKGIRPAINVGLSISRVGSAAQTKAMKKVAGTLKLDLAQYQEFAGFSQFGSDLDAVTLSILHRGARLTEILKQKKHSPLSLAQQIVVLFAGVRGYFDEIELSDCAYFEKKLLEHFKKEHSSLLDEIQTKKDLDKSIEGALDTAMKVFSASYLKSKLSSSEDIIETK